MTLVDSKTAPVDEAAQRRAREYRAQMEAEERTYRECSHAAMHTLMATGQWTPEQAARTVAFLTLRKGAVYALGEANRMSARMLAMHRATATAAHK